MSPTRSDPFIDLTVDDHPLVLVSLGSRGGRICYVCSHNMGLNDIVIKFRIRGDEEGHLRTVHLRCASDTPELYRPHLSQVIFSSSLSQEVKDLIGPQLLSLPTVEQRQTRRLMESIRSAPTPPGPDFGPRAMRYIETRTNSTKKRAYDDDITSSMPVNMKSSKSEGSCCICLQEWRRGTRTVTLPCFHDFHKDCISEWFSRSSLCPICKTDVRKVLKKQYNNVR